MWEFIGFSDNLPCINLIEGKLGILSLLDEETRMPSGNDDSFTLKIQTQFAKNDFFSKPRFNKGFTVHHYALSVTYDTNLFVEKNRDKLPDIELFSNPLLSKKDLDKESTSKQKSVSFKFKVSLQDLVETLSATEAHYVRCIKPNKKSKAAAFEGAYVLEQLRACGVLETIRISCAGYPGRFQWNEFKDRYYMLARGNAKLEGKAFATTVLSKYTDSKNFQVGKTKIFLRSGIAAILEKARNDIILEAAIIIQRMVKGMFARRLFLAKKLAAIIIQSAWRGYKARKYAQSLRETKAAIIIQKYVRRHLAMKKFIAKSQGIVKLQTFVRGFVSRKETSHKIKVNSATKIQATYRMHLARTKYKDTIRKIIMVQGRVRIRFAKKKLKALRMEAKDVHTFKEKSGALERKVFELTAILTDVKSELKIKTEKVNELEGIIASLKDKLSNSESKNEDENQVTKTLRIMYEKTQKEKNEYKTKCDEALEKLKQKDDLIQKNKTRIEELEKRLSSAPKKSPATNKNSIASSMHSDVAPLVTPSNNIRRKTSQYSSTNVKIPGHRESIIYSTSASRSPSKKFRYINIVNEDLIKNLKKVVDKDTKTTLFDVSLDWEILNSLIEDLIIPPTLPPSKRPKEEAVFPAVIFSFTLAFNINGIDSFICFRISR